MTVDIATHFPTKADAFAWYADQGGQRQKSSFYATIPADGKRVSRLAVSELLRGERRKGDDGGGSLRAAEMAELEFRKLKAEVEAKEMAARKESELWLLKEEAYAQMAALVSTLRDSLRHHFHLGQGRLVLLAGGDHARAPEVYEGVEEILARCFNELAAAGRVEVVFEDGGQE